ncbi:CoA transferase [Streptomyces antimycoticus]|uniref:CoA transferase n=1 Tax=Streptomyces antimycoticus TaxID=68175 RepID=A0A4D4KK38_9ACTN|nr:CoA transferase [Streptomyces antimycoticus]GDY48544.1 CoA transferase [Streptomyces antimycoticus]
MTVAFSAGDSTDDTRHDAARSLPLEGVHVLDLSRTIAGQFAARLLADHGAAVTLVQPPPPAARPTLTDPPDSHPHGALHLHLNHTKTIRTLPEDGLEGAVRQYGTDVDVVVVSDHAEAAVAARLVPHALVAVATDFADEGPYRTWQGSELIHQALSGSMHYTGLAGRPPLYGAGNRAYVAAGLFLYLSLVARLRTRPASGPGGEIVRIAVHEAAAAMEQNFSAQWAYSATIAQRGELNRPKGRIRCADGWMTAFAMEGRLAELLAAVGADDLADSPPFSSWQTFMHSVQPAFARIEERSRKHSRESLLRAAVEHRLVMSPVRTPSELRHDPQLLARNFWRHTEFEGRQQLVLGPMWRPAGYEPGAAAGARAGERDGAQALRGPVADGRRAVAPHRPLAGMRVVDFTTAWSGPLATRILALLGAEVLKVESATRMDAWRGPAKSVTATEFYPDADPGDRPYNRNAWFNAQNVGKKSVLLDLKTDTGRKQALGLCGESDLVVTNFTPGTMERLGLGFDELCKVNPTTVMVEMSGFGATGPLQTHRAYGQTMEAMSGIASLIGYDEASGPLGSGSAYLDPMGGLAGAAAALTALLHRERTGRAQYVEVAQREAAMAWIGEIILDAIATGVDPASRGNRRPGAFPHDAFPCQGEDQWIAIAVLDQAQWSALCEELGWTDWAEDPSLREVAGRQARADEITRRLSSVTGEEDKATLARRLQRAGVPAAPVQNGKDLFEDPQLRYRGWFARLTHPEAGTHEYAGLPLEAAGLILQPISAAPLLGQHTTAVLGSPDADGLEPEERSRAGL